MFVSTLQNPASGASALNNQTQIAPTQPPLSPNNQHAINQPPKHNSPMRPAYITPQYSRPHTQWSLKLSSPSKAPIDQAQINEKPWRYLGYPGFATWGASSEDAFVLRRFNALHTRVILYMQDKIVWTEKELENLDEGCRTYNVHNGTFRHDMEPRRNAVLEDLRVRLKDYNEFILAHRQLRSDPRASGHEVKNVKNWFFNNPTAIDEEETRFIDTDGDLVSLVPKVRTPLRWFLDLFVCFRLSFLFRIPPHKWHHYNKEDGYESKTTNYHSDSRMDALVTLIITGVGLGMLIGPLWLLKHFTDETKRLQIISGCLVFFSGLLSIVTVARPFETLAATAGYAAVLMVFIQVGPNTPTA